MFCKFGILLLAAYICRTSAVPPRACARIYMPVCGSDNHTYANQCRFDVAHHSNPALTVAHEGQCGGPTWHLCICNYEDKPVCGSNGETYPHHCALECETRKNPAVQLSHEGPCRNETNEPEHFCECTEELNRVCGSDGVTYANPCLLECKVNQTTGLTTKHAGPCDQVKVAEVKISEEAFPQACTCTRNLKPVCGTDGVTYNNPCLLECAALNKPLAKKSDGICDGSNTVKVEEQAIPPTTCTCTREEKPVCGSDGQTYANRCLVGCAARSNPNLTILHVDACEETAKVDVAEHNETSN